MRPGAAPRVASRGAAPAPPRPRRQEGRGGGEEGGGAPAAGRAHLRPGRQQRGPKHQVSQKFPGLRCCGGRHLNQETRRGGAQCARAAEVGREEARGRRGAGPTGPHRAPPCAPPSLRPSARPPAPGPAPLCDQRERRSGFPGSAFFLGLWDFLGILRLDEKHVRGAPSLGQAPQSRR